MFAHRRNRRLGSEQLEGRFAPSSFFIGAGLRDAQAVDTTQAEQAAQAAFYLAASAVLSQSSSVSNVEPITFDQPAAGEAEGQGFCRVLICICPDPGEMILVGSGDWDWNDNTLHIETWVCTFGPYDTGPIADVPSVDPISTDTPSTQSNEADAVGIVPVEQQPVGEEVATSEDIPPVPDCVPVTGDQVTEPVVEDTGMPDFTNTDELPGGGNDPETFDPGVSANPDAEFMDSEAYADPYADGSSEIASDDVPFEPQSDDAAAGENDGSLADGLDTETAADVFSTDEEADVAW